MLVCHQPFPMQRHSRCNQDRTIPRSLLPGWMPPAVIGAKPLSVMPRGGFIF